MSNQHISLAPVPNTSAVRAAMARAEAKRGLERSIILSLWRQGYDTKDIASRMGLLESFVYNTLSKLRELAKSESST